MTKKRTLIAIISLNLLAGCATRPERRTEDMSSHAYEYGHPRQYYESLDPMERRDLERQMDQEQRWQQEAERKR
jgi:hypothetical protein